MGKVKILNGTNVVSKLTSRNTVTLSAIRVDTTTYFITPYQPYPVHKAVGA